MREPLLLDRLPLRAEAGSQYAVAQMLHWKQRRPKGKASPTAPDLSRCSEDGFPRLWAPSHALLAHAAGRITAAEVAGNLFNALTRGVVHLPDPLLDGLERIVDNALARCDIKTLPSTSKGRSDEVSDPRWLQFAWEIEQQRDEIFSGLIAAHAFGTGSDANTETRSPMSAVEALRRAATENTADTLFLQGQMMGGISAAEVACWNILRGVVLCYNSWGVAAGESQSGDTLGGSEGKAMEPVSKPHAELRHSIVSAVTMDLCWLSNSMLVTRQGTQFNPTFLYNSAMERRVSVGKPDNAPLPSRQVASAILSRLLLLQPMLQDDPFAVILCMESDDQFRGTACLALIGALLRITLGTDVRSRLVALRCLCIVLPRIDTLAAVQLGGGDAKRVFTPNLFDTPASEDGASVMSYAAGREGASSILQEVKNHVQQLAASGTALSALLACPIGGGSASYQKWLVTVLLNLAGEVGDATRVVRLPFCYISSLSYRLLTQCRYCNW